jgi:O-antigen/teichoic acid export membrane protein
MLVVAPLTLSKISTSALKRIWQDAKLWGIVDQCIASAGNFLSSVLVARSLHPNTYGLFALLLSFFIIGNNFQALVVCYPMSVLGAQSDQHALRSLVGKSLLLTVPITACIGGIVSIVLYSARVKPPISWKWVVLALLCWQLQETTRRGLMAHLRHKEAIWGDAISYLGQAAWIGILVLNDSVSLTSIFIAMSSTSAGALVLQAAQLGLFSERIRPKGEDLIRTWQISRPMLGAWFAGLANNELFVWVLSWKDVADAAIFQAFVNVLRAPGPLVAGIQNALVPSVARAQKMIGKDTLRTVIGQITVAGLALMPFFFAVLLFPKKTLQLVYGSSSQYVAYASDFRVLGFGFFVSYIVAVSGAWVMGFGKATYLFRARIWGGAVGAAVGLPLVWTSGVFGGVLAYLISAGVQAGYFVAVFCRGL